MPTRIHIATLLLVIALTAGCAQAIPRPSSGLGQTPASATPEPATRRFVIDRIGEDYFRAHYVLAQADSIAPDVIKATYLYTYQPYVRDYPFTLFLNTRTQTLSDEEVSTMLLEPQAFNISHEGAISIALQNGLQPTRGDYDVSLSFGPTTQNRFAWDVANPDVSPSGEVPEPVVRIVLDVEDGEVYAMERTGPMKAH